MKIEKKCWPESFQAILDGIKTCEVRLNDFECKSGDLLLLREWNPDTKEYTGRTLERKISLVQKTKEMIYWKKEDVDKLGLQILSLK